jgi:hypothetical protein
MKEFAIGGLLTILSGLAAIAYNHPDTFKRLSWWLIALVFSGYLTTIAWFVAIELASKAVAPMLGYAATEKVLSHLALPIWALVGPPCAGLLYIGVLSNWVTQLKPQNSDQKVDDAEMERS